MDPLRELLRHPDGLASRPQLLDGVLTETSLAKALRRGTLFNAIPGVYVEHNGPLLWQQRAWAAVLHAWPAALCLTCSVLEHGYLDRVVRPHGSPRGRLQAPGINTAGAVFRDVEHPDLDLNVELDGRLFHTSAQDRDRDLERDLDAADSDGRTTLRLGFGQVYERGCATAAKVGAVMQRQGWNGPVTPCADCRPGMLVA